jgi:CDGSH-type Zn-finger protein
MPTTTVKILNNGPCLVTGDFEIQDAQGTRFETEKGKPAALCRCGASSKKPFCDGAHSKAGFKSEVSAKK